VSLGKALNGIALVVTLEVTVGSLTRRPQRSLRCLEIKEYRYLNNRRRPSPKLVALVVASETCDALRAGIGMTIILPGLPMSVTHYCSTMNNCTILFWLLLICNNCTILFRLLLICIVLKQLVLGIYLCKVPRPGYSKVTFSVFRVKLSPVTTNLTIQR